MKRGYMLQVPNDYYESEVRDGFFISSEMKRCWAATIEVLSQIDRICKKHGLKYFADYGTMMGTVRHGGFIPWDDDLDICMLRNDFLKFISVAKEELPTDYDVLSYHINYKYNNHLTRVVNNTFICMEEGFLKANHDFPFAVGVDIFPLDYVKIDERQNENQRELINEAIGLGNEIDEEETDVENLGNLGIRVKQLFNDCGCELINNKPIRQQVYVLADRLMYLYNGDESDKIVHAFFWAQYNNHIYPKECYKYAINMKFEYTTIPVPIGYDYLLCSDYGPNYMTPMKSGGLHEYPVYIKQKRVMYEVLNQYYYKNYLFDEKEMKRPKIDMPDRDRREVVFLPVQSKHWKSLEQEWIKECNTPDTDVYVIPLPYYRKKSMRLDEELCYEGAMFPEYVNVIGFDAYDFDTRKPDRIYINNPFDQYDEGISVHPRFYTKNLRDITNELYYIPFFSMDNNIGERDKAIAPYYTRVPGVLMADKVLVQSQEIKELYRENLAEFAPNVSDEVWDNKIEIINNDKTIDECVGLLEEDVPDAWWQYLLTDDGEGKKVILYHTSVSNIVEYGERYFEKVRRAFDIFDTEKDKMTVLWLIGHDTQEVLESGYVELWDKLVETVNLFMEKNLGIYDDSWEYERAALIADAYYGDRSPVLFMVSRMKKPIMIQNMEV